MAGLDVALGIGCPQQKTVERDKTYRIIEPSFEIMAHLDDASVEKRIDECARICYKSEDDAGKETPVEFCRKMRRHKHNSTIEMAVLTYHVIAMGDVRALREISAYIIIDHYEYGYLITGSVRAFREAYMKCPENALIRGLACAVAQQHPVFFEDLALDMMQNSMSQLIEKVDLETLDEDIKKNQPALWRRHRFIAVKLVVNRAVTHELVRHRPCSFLQESQRYCRYSHERFGSAVTFIKPMFFAENSPEYNDWLEVMAFTSKKYLKLLETSTPQAARTVLPNSCKTEIIVFCSVEQWNHICHMRTSPAAEPSMREVMIPLQAELRRLFLGESFDKRSPEGYLEEYKEAA